MLVVARRCKTRNGELKEAMMSQPSGFKTALFARCHHVTRHCAIDQVIYLLKN